MTRVLAIRGHILAGEALVPGAVVVRGRRVAAVLRRPRASELPARALAAHIVAPGFIDLQVNGAFGVEVGSGGAEALRVLRARLPETGVTGFVATLVSSRPAAYRRIARDVSAARSGGGARLLGLHLEGPLLSPRRAGAHDPQIIAAAAGPVAGGDAVRLVTLAPERPGALAAIRRLAARGVIVSVGHTDASYDEVVRAADAGARMVTHLYNAMSPFAGRHPGAVGAALVDDRLVVGLIADGVHCHAAALRLAARAKGPLGVVLVTDAMAAAGMPPGDYALAGRRVHSDGVAARLDDGVLAGSVLRMDRAVRNMVELAGVPVAAALRMAGEAPARLLGLARSGRIVPGADADLVLLDEELGVQATLVGGEVAWGQGAN
jgi:N-acetylglucosamine-6-phosphate deacetylase